MFVAVVGFDYFFLRGCLMMNSNGFICFFPVYYIEVDIDEPTELSFKGVWRCR